MRRFLTLFNISICLIIIGGIDTIFGLYGVNLAGYCLLIGIVLLPIGWLHKIGAI